MTSDPIAQWLDPFRGLLDPNGRFAWSLLREFADDLDATLETCPVGPELPPGAERSRRLLRLRRELADRGHVDLTGAARLAPLVRLFRQFLCGYRDIDLRDSAGLGHGELIARHGSTECRRCWLPRLRAGDLAGIAITEAHGGSRPAATTTAAVPGPTNTLLVSGRKTWISRLTEAAVFVVFFRAPDDRLAAATVDAHRPELHRQLIQPAGLAGWSWGFLDLDQVPVRSADILHGDGMTLLREHFAGYRPLVAATALGAAAAVFDTVTDTLTARQSAGDLPRLRDSALVTLGRAHAQINTALLGAAIATNLADTRDPDAELWGAATKAHGVDTAHQAVAELALLLGAAGFRADSQTAKTGRDLSGLRYADGIHDNLYRAAGKRHTDTAPVPQPRTHSGNVPTAVRTELSRFACPARTAP
ncbi:MAG: hypothetical protein GEV28_03950 [Actinophytocola sp.]|uniref:acyl-CoA dehydrogenase family protein n=1 Tax=Actinophytocola sp. TaxID=1872138 RepID=UPI00132C8C2F|nr:acyl-CoA dehydrogenase family protein [Actinophytocola sp.]MPZ79586.1 hypothetical protein [Actinophytocola sp.]